VEERRFYKRIPYEGNIRFNTVKDGLAYDEISPLINLSGGGLGIVTQQSLTTQQDIVFEINIPSYVRSIAARGEVIWAQSLSERNDCLVGIKFTNINTYDRHIILDYVHFG